MSAKGCLQVTKSKEVPWLDCDRSRLWTVRWMQVHASSNGERATHKSKRLSSIIQFMIYWGKQTADKWSVLDGEEGLSIVHRMMYHLKYIVAFVADKHQWLIQIEVSCSYISINGGSDSGVVCSLKSFSTLHYLQSVAPDITWNINI